jgi:hypothetical protein
MTTTLKQKPSNPTVIDSPDNHLKISYPLQKGEELLQIRKITDNCFRLNFWGKKQIVPYKPADMGIIRSLWVKVSNINGKWTSEVQD